MEFLEKLGDLIYDIVGYIIPGVIALIFFIPSYQIYEDCKAIITPAEAICKYPWLESIKALSAINLNFVNVTLILLLAYVAGHVIKGIGELYYKGNIAFTRSVFNRELIETLFNKAPNTLDGYVVARAKSIFENNFKCKIPNEKIESSEDLLTSYGRTQIRMYNIPSFLQKYVSKYIFYRSLSAVSVLFGINIIIIFFMDFNQIIKIFSIVSICGYISICRKQFKNRNKMSSPNDGGCKARVFQSNLIAYILLLFFAIWSYFHKTMISYLICYVSSLILYSVFNSEYISHYKLNIKEALYGIIYVEENKQKDTLPEKSNLKEKIRNMLGL